MKIPGRDLSENLSKSWCFNFQDVNHVLAAVDHVIDIGLLDPSRIAVLGGSHGGFLVTHLIGQVPDKFAFFYSKSPISRISKVKTPTILLLGAKDLYVPVSNGLQYARALKEKGVEVKVMVFSEDTHAIDRPQSDFENFLNIGTWFKNYCKWIDIYSALQQEFPDSFMLVLLEHVPQSEKKIKPFIS